VVPLEELFPQSFLRYTAYYLDEVMDVSTWLMWDDDANPFSDEMWITLGPLTRARLIEEGHPDLDKGPDLDPTPSVHPTLSISILLPDTNLSETPPTSTSASVFESRHAQTNAGWGKSKPSDDPGGRDGYLANRPASSDADTSNWHGIQGVPAPLFITPPVSVPNYGECNPFVTTNGLIIHPPTHALYPEIYAATGGSELRPSYEAWCSAIGRSIDNISVERDE